MGYWKLAIGHYLHCLLDKVAVPDSHRSPIRSSHDAPGETASQNAESWPGRGAATIGVR